MTLLFFFPVCLHLYKINTRQIWIYGIYCVLAKTIEKTIQEHLVKEVPSHNSIWIFHIQISVLAAFLAKSQNHWSVLLKTLTKFPNTRVVQSVSLYPHRFLDVGVKSPSLTHWFTVQKEWSPRYVHLVISN